jgi:arylsulfatase A-like enzyme
LYAHQAGVGHMTDNKGTPAYQGYLNDSCVTIAEALRQNGYRTMMTGKWHIGTEKGHWPCDRGFDRFYGGPMAPGHYFRLDKGRTLLLDNKQIDPPADWYATDAFTDYALQFLDEAAKLEKPFLLYLAYTTPHWPLHAKPADIDKYRGKYMDGWDTLRQKRYDKLISQGIIDKSWPLSPNEKGEKSWDDVKNKEEWALRMAVYAAQIDCMDQNIGKVMAKLKEMNAEENTLVLFFSDNGGCAEVQDKGKAGAEIGTPDSFTSYRKPWANASNTPFRLYKHYNHEGGTSSPFIAYWPSKIKKGELSNSPAHVIDIMPTCLEMAGVSYPKQFNGRDIIPVEGKSLLPLFEDKMKEVHDVIYWEHEGNRAVRQGDWKLVAENNTEWELYDLKSDRSELKNLAAQHPEKVLELGGLYRKWADRCGVVTPKTLNKKK